MCEALAKESREWVLSKQLLKSGTSIGANVAEGQHSQSDNDFIAKFCIALKEAWETDFWVRLLHDADHIDVATKTSLLSDLSEIIALLTASIKTAKKRAP